MRAPAGRSANKALTEAPSHPLKAPIPAESHNMRGNRCVQKRAAAAGMMRNAMMRMSPTAWSPVTVTAVTRTRRRMSNSRTGQPVEAAKASSKQSRVNSLSRSSTVTEASTATTEMRTTSLKTIEAALP